MAFILECQRRRHCAAAHGIGQTALHPYQFAQHERVQRGKLLFDLGARSHEPVVGANGPEKQHGTGYADQQGMSPGHVKKE